MEFATITDSAKKSIIALCNKAVVLEYDFILNYPRIADHIRNFEKIEDEQLIKELEQLGKESIGHFVLVEKMVTGLGGQMDWQANMLPRLVGVEDIIRMQWVKEQEACDLYMECRRIAMNNKTVIRAGGFLDRLLGRDIQQQKIVLFEQVVSDFDRLIADEQRHARMAEDIIAAHKVLVSRKE